MGGAGQAHERQGGNAPDAAGRRASSRSCMRRRKAAPTRSTPSPRRSRSPARWRGSATPPRSSASTHDLAGIDALLPRRPLLVFNLVDAVGGDCRLAPMVPARLDALGLALYRRRHQRLARYAVEDRDQAEACARRPADARMVGGRGAGFAPMRASSSSRCGSMARSASAPPRWCSAPTLPGPSPSARCAGTPSISPKAISTGGSSPRAMMERPDGVERAADPRDRVPGFR